MYKLLPALVYCTAKRIWAPKDTADLPFLLYSSLFPRFLRSYPPSYSFQKRMSIHSHFVSCNPYKPLFWPKWRFSLSDHTPATILLTQMAFFPFRPYARDNSFDLNSAFPFQTIRPRQFFWPKVALFPFRPYARDNSFDLNGAFPFQTIRPRRQ